MDLEGIPKRSERARIIEAYQHCSGNNNLPLDRYLLTLGGPAAAPTSEMNYFCRQRKFCRLDQYVSIERDRQVHETNTRIRGPKWIHGELASEFRRCYHRYNKEIGIVNADLMCGMDNALETICEIFCTLESQYRYNHDLFEHSAPSPEIGCLVIVNVIDRNRRSENRGYTFPDVFSTFENSCMKKYCKKLVDRHTYDNKTVGKGSRITTMHTLMFWV